MIFIFKASQSVRSFLENPNEVTAKSIETNDFGGFRLPYFTGRSTEMTLIDENFVTSQIAVIEGDSGSGKTTLAQEYAYKKNANDPRFIVKFMNSFTFLSELELIGKSFKVFRKDTKTVLDFLNDLKTEINKFTIENKLRFLFIIDNVTEKDLLVKRFISGLSENCKIILTTKYTNLNENYFTLTLQPFDFNDFTEILQKRDSITLSAPEKEVFASMGFKKGMKVSPLKLNRLLIRLKKNGNSWKFENMRSLLEREENRFRLIKNEFPIAFECLNVLAYLSGQSVPFELLRAIFIGPNDDLIRALDYLVKHAEISVNQRGYYSINETSQYEFKRLAHFGVSIEDLFDKIVLALNSLIFEDDLVNSEMNGGLSAEILNLINQAKHVLKNDTRTKSSNKNVSELHKKIGLVKSEYFQKSDQQSQPTVINNNNNVYSKSNNNSVTTNENPSDQAKELVQMSYENEKNCDYKSAMSNLNEAIEIYTQILPSNHLTLAYLKNDLASMQVIFGGDYEEALKNHSRALTILNQNLPVNQILKANTLFGIANAYNYQGMIKILLG
jgi:tetratricopeptide (TPR) repeat protein